jgi:Chloramphenicol phosphotransferase-like protein
MKLYEPVVVSLQGHSRAGKTTLANHLQDQYQWVKVSFADPLKQTCMDALGLRGDTDGHDPRVLSALPSVSRRVTLLEPYQVTVEGFNKVKQAIDSGFNVVIDDLRMASEWVALKQSGYNWYPLRCVADNTTPRNTWDTNLLHLAKYTIHNTGTVEDMASQLADLFRTSLPYGDLF